MAIREKTEKHIARLRNIFETNGFKTCLLVTRPLPGLKFDWHIQGSPSLHSEVPMQCLRKFVDDLLSQFDPNAIIIHGISFPAFILKLAQAAICPIYRYMHEPRMVCPGHGKFLYNSETICEKPFDYHCLASAYKEICAPRNPKKLLDRFYNTRFELKQGYKYYTKIIVASEYMRKEAVIAGLPACRLFKIPPPMDIDPVPFRPIPSGLPRILFVGRISQTKGPHVLIRMLAPLLQRHPDWQLDLVGDGIIKNHCIRLADEFSISRQVNFHGWKSSDELEAFYYDCSLVVFPTLYPEAFGGVGLESFRYGRAVVAFDVGGVSEWLRDGVNGRLVQPGNQIKFAEAVEDLLSNIPKLNHIGQSSQKMIYDRFGPEVTFKRYCKIFQSS